MTLEQDTLGGTITHFPRGKLVMTAPFTLSLAGKFNFTELSKEDLVALFEKIAAETGLRVNEGERVETIAAVGNGFEVKSARAVYKARSVLLTIGRRGTPRMLDVPGEDQAKVVYRLIDPGQYRGQRVLVVGGGDAALEAACAVADQPDTVVTLSHRSASFNRAKSKNRDRVADAQKSGRLNVLLNSSIERIGLDDVDIKLAEEICTLENDAVIGCVGGILPTPFLESIGIKVETKYGTA